MAKVDPRPDDEELAKRRQPKYVINPYEVTKKEDARARQWAATTIRKIESKLTDKVPQGFILARGHVKPEEVDIRQVYDFPDLHWVVFYRRRLFHLALLSRNKILFVSSFAKV